MTWQQLQSEGRVRPHATSRSELDSLRAVVTRDLEDAAIEALSNDRRFAIAYNAALQTSKMVIACAGFRVTGQGHHQTSFEALELAIGPTVTRFAVFYETCRRKRNMLDYDLSGLATQTEVEQLLLETSAFVEIAEEWIETHHPNLARQA